MKELSKKLIEQIKTSTQLGIDLIDTIEFQTLAKELFANEILHGVIVGIIEYSTWMIGLTDRRLILIKKAELYGSEIRQFGLEEILNIKLETQGYKANLIFDLAKDLGFKITEINIDNSRIFGRKLVNNMELWNSNFVGYLI
ncbi:hypothetical protein ESOMN_v1c04490 [Williamsoniiplasma somnilux]|uniref:YokE-like PH domain-containing protein n=1 Tax=Williamsoniiplasma somnilux TaxID=215578 RepID=A0A2K8P1E7_9MOLU|nr:PH domain-containing protein [Williamsoniiplasma somnilux]ATZ18831.1 hypothetical protein ESOMN_v1c04490 [Williamsoniiplasma somnilux]